MYLQTYNRLICKNYITKWKINFWIWENLHMIKLSLPYCSMFSYALSGFIKLMLLRLSLFYFSLFDECLRCFRPPQYAHFIFFISHIANISYRSVYLNIYYWTTVSLFSPFSNCLNKINNTHTHFKWKRVTKLFSPKLFI